MEQHAFDLLKMALVVLGGAGSLVLLLLATIAGIAKWNGRQILARMDKQDATMDDIKNLLTSETKLLRDSLHHHDVRLVRLEAFKEQALNVMHFGRRVDDQNGGE